MQTKYFVHADVSHFVAVQLAIQVATLEFFCNRPTVVALTEFGSDVSTIQAALTAAQEAALAAGIGLVVYGLQGRGKVRTIFQLLLDMDTARVYLNLEDGEQLAVMAEERIHMDLKVSAPGSISSKYSLIALENHEKDVVARRRYTSYVPSRTHVVWPTVDCCFR